MSKTQTCERVEGVEYPRDLHDCISVQTWTFLGPKFIIRGVPFHMIHAISWRPLNLSTDSIAQPSRCRLVHRGDEIIREECGYANYMHFSHPLPIFCLTYDELQLVFLDVENNPIRDNVEMEVALYCSNFADGGVAAREMTRSAFYWTALGYFNPHTLLKITHWMITRPYTFPPEVQYYGIDDTCEGKKCDCESLSSYSVFKKDIEEHNMRIYSVNMINYLDKWRVRCIKRTALRKVSGEGSEPHSSSPTPLVVNTNEAILKEVETEMTRKRALLSAGEISSLGVSGGITGNGVSGNGMRDAFEDAQEPRKDSCLIS